MAELHNVACYHCSSVAFWSGALIYEFRYFQYHKGWNHFFTFLQSVTDGMIARAIVLWLTSIEQSQANSSRVSQRFFDVQPAAAKSIDNDEDDKTDNSQ